MCSNCIPNPSWTGQHWGCCRRALSRGHLCRSRRRRWGHYLRSTQEIWFWSSRPEQPPKLGDWTTRFTRFDEKGDLYSLNLTHSLDSLDSFRWTTQFKASLYPAVGTGSSSTPFRVGPRSPGLGRHAQAVVLAYDLKPGRLWRATAPRQWNR